MVLGYWLIDHFGSLISVNLISSWIKKKGNETNFLEFTLWPLDFIKLYYDPKNF